jgi:elongation factor P
LSKTISDTDKFKPADISYNNYDYLYNDGDNYYFMNQSTYEQVSLSKKAL